MKILLLNREYPPIVGGGGVLSKHLAEEFVKIGHKVDIITGSLPGTPKFEIVNGVNIYRVTTFSRTHEMGIFCVFFYILFGFIKAIRLHLKNKYDVVNSHFAVPAGIISVLMGKFFKLKNVLTIIGGDIYEPANKLSPHRIPIFRFIVKKVIAYSDAVAAISNNIKLRAKKYYNVKKNIDVISVGFKSPVFKQISRKELDLVEDNIYIVSVATLTARKNFQSLIKAFAKIKSSKAELIIIGDGPLRNELELLAQKMGINDRVRFLGFVEDEKKFQLLAVADIFAMISLHEGFGIVFNEAMNASLSIIAGNDGGQTDFLHNNTNSLLIDPQNIEEVYKAMDRLVSDQELRNRLGKKAKEDLAGLGIREIANQYLKVYN